MLAFDKIKEIEVSEFHTSNAEATYLATYGGKYYEINAVVAGVLEIAKQANTIDDAVIRYVEASGNRYTEDDVREFLDRCMELFDTAEQPKRPFILRFDLVSAEKITWLTRKLAFLFDVRILFPLLAIAAVLDGYFCATDTLLVTAGSIDLYVIIGLLLFIIASSCIHELGHAAACRYYGIEHGNVGFGLYLNFPVFYTDVSNIWRLKRGQRCVVNLAGIYFQSIILLPVLVAYFVTGHPVLKYLILLTNINFVITLNPFFRFDGYWLMTDLLGIANLRAKSMELLRYLYYRMRGKAPDGWKPALLMVKPAYRYALFAYSVVVNLFFGYYFFYIIPLFIIHFVESFPGLFRTLLASLSSGTMPDFGIIQQIVAQLLFMAITVYFLYRMVKPLARSIKWKRVSDRS